MSLIWSSHGNTREWLEVVWGFTIVCYMRVMVIVLMWWR